MGFFAEHVRPRMLTLSLGPRMTREIRTRVSAGLQGDVLEIGYGSGLNQPYLPAAVTGVWAVEPSQVALRMAARRRAESPVPVVDSGNDAHALPFPDDRFDAALCTWVLCGLREPARALDEVARVLKPGAALHFVEHGLAPDAGVARWQRRGNRFNRLGAGCVLDQDLRRLLDDSRLTVSSLDQYYEKGAPRVAGSMYEGRAVA